MVSGAQRGLWFYWGDNGALASVFDFGDGEGRQRGFYWDWQSKTDGQPALRKIEDYERGELVRTFKVEGGRVIEVASEE